MLTSLQLQTQTGRLQQTHMHSSSTAAETISPEFSHETECERYRIGSILKNKFTHRHTHTQAARNTEKIGSSFSVVCTASKPPTTTTKPQYVSKHLAIYPLPDSQQTHTNTHTHKQKFTYEHLKMHTLAFFVPSKEEHAKSTCSCQSSAIYFI